MHVAVLGYAFDLDRSFASPFVEALTWLRARRYFVQGRPLAFEIDGLALLGVAVGILKLDQPEAAPAAAWLRDLLAETLRRSRPADWNESLIHAASACLSSGHDWAQHRGVADDLTVALSAKWAFALTEAMRASAWALISSLSGEDDGTTRAATQLAAMTRLLRDASTLRPGSTTPADVARLLSGVNRSLRRWAWEDAPRTSRSAAAQWAVENEYHVQDMLWVVLAPVFPDLDDEEWLKSLGQHHPRADLAIPSLRVIVEVKFLRKGKSAFSKIIQEVAADAGTYLQDGSGFDTIVAFVWDDEARTEEHEELRRGLMQIRGVEDAIVVSRPSKMTRPSSAEEDPA
ncbi:hypothetical protein BC358_06160 [Hydrogenophaga sp. H7]|nr:hypothetical protein BC358_06160 [Hydrogenophaga sp. H7]